MFFFIAHWLYGFARGHAMSPELLASSQEARIGGDSFFLAPNRRRDKLNAPAKCSMVAHSLKPGARAVGVVRLWRCPGGAPRQITPRGNVSISFGAARILDRGGRAQRRHRSSVSAQPSKAAWRFASRRRPKRIGAQRSGSARLSSWATRSWSCALLWPRSPVSVFWIVTRAWWA